MISLETDLEEERKQARKEGRERGSERGREGFCFLGVLRKRRSSRGGGRGSRTAALSDG